MLFNIKNKLKDGGIWRHFAILTGGTLVSRVLLTAVTPILTRLYAPADFGILSIFISLLTFMIIVSSLNYEAAIPLPEDDNAGFNLMGLSFLFLVCISVGSVIVVFFFGRQLTVFFNAPALNPYLWLLPVSLIAGGIFTILNNWVLRIKAFVSLAKRRISQSVAQVITQVSFPLFFNGPIGLLVGDAVGRSVGSTILIRETISYARKQKLQFSIILMIKAAKQYRIFPTFGLTTVVLHSGFGILPPLLISRLYGLHDAGLFLLVSSVFAAGLSLIGLSMAQVYMAHASKLAHKSPLEMKALFLKLSRTALITGAIPCCLILLSGPFLFGAVFGIKWLEAGVYSQILALPYFVMFVVGPVHPTLRIFSRQDLQLRADLLGIVLLVLGMTSFCYIGLSARWAVLVYGFAIIVTYSLLYLYAFKVIKEKCSNIVVTSNETG